MSNNNSTLVLCLCKNAKGFNKKLILIQYYIEIFVKSQAAWNSVKFCCEIFARRNPQSAGFLILSPLNTPQLFYTIATECGILF